MENSKEQKVISEDQNGIHNLISKISKMRTEKGDEKR